MKSEDKNSLRAYRALVEEFTPSCLAKYGFRLKRKERYERQRDDFVNAVTFHCVNKSGLDYCIMSVYLGITFRQPAELIGECVSLKKVAIGKSTIVASLVHLLSPYSPAIWTDLNEESNAAEIGPILSRQYEEAAIPFFEKYSSIENVLATYGWSGPNAKFSHSDLLVGAAMWLKGEKEAAIDFLDTKEQESRKIAATNWSIRREQSIDAIHNFRVFLSERK